MVSRYSQATLHSSKSALRPLVSLLSPIGKSVLPGMLDHNPFPFTSRSVQIFAAPWLVRILRPSSILPSDLTGSQELAKTTMMLRMRQRRLSISSPSQIMQSHLRHVMVPREHGWVSQPSGIEIKASVGSPRSLWCHQHRVCMSTHGQRRSWNPVEGVHNNHEPLSWIPQREEPQSLFDVDQLSLCAGWTMITPSALPSHNIYPS